MFDGRGEGIDDDGRCEEGDREGSIARIFDDGREDGVDDGRCEGEGEDGEVEGEGYPRESRIEVGIVLSAGGDGDFDVGGSMGDSVVVFGDDGCDSTTVG